MTIVTVGIDLAKNVFAVHGVDAAGKPVLVRPNVARGKLLELIAALPPCLIGMEACSGAHHWAREFQKLGHTARLMAPKFVAPYLRSLLVMGARAMLAAAMNSRKPKQDPISRWARSQSYQLNATYITDLAGLCCTNKKVGAITPRPDATILRERCEAARFG
jgi:transposase